MREKLEKKNHKKTKTEESAFVWVKIYTTVYSSYIIYYSNFFQTETFPPLPLEFF